MPEGKDSAHGKGPYGARDQRDLLGGIEAPNHKKSSSEVSIEGMFDASPELISKLEPVIPEKNKRPIIIGGADYFRGREFPTDVWAPTGVAYYERLEDIPTQSFRNRRYPLKVDSYEERSAVALQVCPPIEGESDDASFKLIGERGLYVRVILGEKEEAIGGVKRKKQIIRWMPFNEEDTDLKHIRRL